jgi:hypothetical protein
MSRQVERVRQKIGRQEGKKKGRAICVEQCVSEGNEGREGEEEAEKVEGGGRVMQAG